MTEQPKFEIPDEILSEMLTTGLIVVGQKNCGKTVAMKWLARQLMNREDVRVFIADTAQNWRFDFDTIPFIELKDTTEALPDTKNMLYDVELINSNEIRLAIGMLALQDYDLRRALKKENNGMLPYWSVYILEEIHNYLGSFSLRGSDGAFWLSLASQGRNFKQTIFGITQRLADVSPQIIERAKGMLLGCMAGDNDLKKLKRVVGSDIAKKVTLLKQGEFLYWNGDKRQVYDLKFPLFTPVGRPESFFRQEKDWFIKKLRFP